MSKLIHGHCLGDQSTTTYNIWISMRNRCERPKARGYKNYGAKGVSVCERWKLFENFLADMGPRPSADKSIDRFPNKTGNYEPGNCRWATQREQQNNRTNNHRITINGVTLTLSEWARAAGLKPSLVNDRINRYGWTIQMALSKVSRQGGV